MSVLAFDELLPRKRKTPIPTAPGLSPLAREILARTRVARMVLDARLGIIPERIKKLMSNGKDVLEDDDLAFLQNIGGLEAAVGKLKEARRLVAEARAEIAEALGSEEPKPRKISRKKAKRAKPAKAPGKNGKRTKKTPEVHFGVEVPDELSDAEQKALAALKELGATNKKAVMAKTKLGDYAVGKALGGLVERKLAKATGSTFGRRWEAK